MEGKLARERARAGGDQGATKSEERRPVEAGQVYERIRLPLFSDAAFIHFLALLDSNTAHGGYIPPFIIFHR